MCLFVFGRESSLPNCMMDMCKTADTQNKGDNQWFVLLRLLQNHITQGTPLVHLKNGLTGKRFVLAILIGTKVDFGFGCVFLGGKQKQSAGSYQHDCGASRAMILSTRQPWRPPSKLVVRNTSTICLMTSAPVTRAPAHTICALLCARAMEAVYAS
jgi:hypothetical protein